MTESSAVTDRSERIAAEGDPNHVPFRNSKDGPRLEWSTADGLQAGEKVMLSNRFIWTVEHSEASAPSEWRLVLVDPKLTVVRAPRDVDPVMPGRLEYRLSPGALYRRVSGSAQD